MSCPWGHCISRESKSESPLRTTALLRYKLEVPPWRKEKPAHILTKHYHRNPHTRSKIIPL